MKVYVKDLLEHRRTLLNKAFSLAEVLITLGIIGVVAAMTISNLVQSSREQQTITALKKAYSTLSTAFATAQNDYGSPEYWVDWSNPKYWISGGDSERIFDIMTENMNILTKCGGSYGLNECAFSDYKKLSGSPGVKLPLSESFIRKAVLADGSFLIFGRVYSTDCDVSFSSGPVENAKYDDICSSLYVDINGAKAPNQYGVDTFGFFLAKHGIVPNGAEGDATGSCNKKYYDGSNCTAWVLFNRNMDYMKCDDLSWSGKHTCSN